MHYYAIGDDVEESLIGIVEGDVPSIHSGTVLPPRVGQLQVFDPTYQ